MKELKLNEVSSLSKRTHYVIKLGFKSGSVWFQRLCLEKLLMDLFLARKNSFVSRVSSWAQYSGQGQNHSVHTTGEAGSDEIPFPFVCIH